jgi:L-iditol 2-dehydrogenase
MLTSRAAVIDAPNGQFSISSAPVPDPEPGSMILRQELCGICGTDAHIARGHLPFVKFPVVMGHECVGVVEALGSGVSTDMTGRPLSLGDRVYLVPGMRCGRCYFCVVTNEPVLCIGTRAFGFGPLPDKPREVQGGYAQYLYLPPEAGVLRMDVEALQAAILEPLAISMHVTESARFLPGDTVVVQGAGAIGLLTMLAAREAGADHVMVVGAPASRLGIAREFGATDTIDLATVRDGAERVRLVQEFSRSGLGADVVFECTGVPAAVPEGIDMLRRGGRYVVAGHFTDVGGVEMNPYAHFTRKQITLQGVWSSDRTHFVRGRALVESGRYDFRRLISHRLPLERVGDGIQAMSGAYVLDGREVMKVVIAANDVVG